MSISQNSKKKIKLAIVGATSFIGGELLSYIYKKNFKVVATYKTKKNIKKKYNFKWKKLDIKKKKINYFNYLENPDILINLSWPDIPNYQLKKHFLTSSIQKRFVQNLIKNGLKNIIILGSCYEYGRISGKIDEKKPEKPIIAYAKAKLKLLKSIQKLKYFYSFKLTWLRPFFVYGYNSKRKNLYTLLKNLDQNNLNQLNVCGNLIRDFVPVKYLCSSILKIISLNKDFGILNICTGKGTTVKNFIKKNIKNKRFFRKINMNAINPNSFEPKSFWGDKKKLNKILKNTK